MHFPAGAASILFLSIFGHKIGVLKSPALFHGKELQVTRFKSGASGHVVHELITETNQNARNAISKVKNLIIIIIISSFMNTLIIILLS